jgi:hypothetical protein
MERRYHSPEGVAGDPFAAASRRTAQDLHFLSAWCSSRGDLKDVAPALRAAATAHGGGSSGADVDEAVFAIVDRCGDLLGLKDAQVCTEG